MTENQNGFKKDYFLPLSILVAAVLIGASVIYSTGVKTVGRDQAADLGNIAGAALTNEQLIDDDIILGDPEAPVTIVEFGDYQCPFCGRFFSQTESQIKKDYVQTGKVKMVYRDFAFLGPESKIAALAAQCAGEQDKYWVFHDRLFEIEVADGVEHNGNLSVSLMKSLAKESGLNQVQFNACFDSGKYNAEIEKDYNDGVAAGVAGTPATFVNGKLVEGAQPYSVFKDLIEAALNK